MILLFFSSFCSSAHCKEVYERLCDAQSLPYWCATVASYEASSHPRRLYITTDTEAGVQPTHIIFLNYPPPPALLRGVPKERVLGLAFEPPPFLNLTPALFAAIDATVGQYFLGDRPPNSPAAVVPHFGYMWHTPPIRPPRQPAKPRLMSLMVSEKRTAPGHQLRHRIAQHILTRNLPIDIWGRGCAFYRPVKDPRLRGPFHGKEPYLDYRFHIAIENFSFSHYFSEKLMDPLLCGTTPLYWGCTQLQDYFPAEVCRIPQFRTFDEAVALIESICRDPDAFAPQINVPAVEDKINLLAHVHDLFEPSLASLGTVEELTSPEPSTPIVTQNVTAPAPKSKPKVTKPASAKRKENITS